MSNDAPVYEMLWDCKYCGQRKLLGLTHRYCAACGAPQDPSARYFPPDNEKVPVQGHPYVGADVACPACRQPMSRAARCCTSCGSPLDKGAEVARRADVVAGPPGSPMLGGAHPGAPMPGGAPPGLPPGAGRAGVPTAPRAKSSAGLLIAVIGGVFLLIVGVILVFAFWKREGAFEVAGHSWERSVAIERYEAVRKKVWCDEAPSGARVLSRRAEQRGTREEPDGETCTARKQDLGNGTFQEVQDCQPKTKRVPKMEDRCEIQVHEWNRSRVLAESGASVSDVPRWPDVDVRGGTCGGCEREGARTERYTVEFIDAEDGSPATCDVPEADWAGFAKGSKWKGKVGALTGKIDCTDLTRL